VRGKEKKRKKENKEKRKRKNIGKRQFRHLTPQSNR
jgi:hypothetical protein